MRNAPLDTLQMKTKKIRILWDLVPASFTCSQTSKECTFEKFSNNEAVVAEAVVYFEAKEQTCCKKFIKKYEDRYNRFTALQLFRLCGWTSLYPCILELFSYLVGFFRSHLPYFIGYLLLDTF